MRLHTRISDWIQCISSMVERKISFQVRLSQAALDEIDDLVSAGKYSSRSDFISRGAYELLARQHIRDEIKRELTALISDPEFKREMLTLLNQHD